MTKMEVMFQNENELEQIRGIIDKNSKTLTKVVFSAEAVDISYQKFNSDIFAKCCHLQELKLLKTGRNRNNKLIRLDQMPKTLKMLKLEGFIPEIVEIGMESSWSHLENLVFLSLGSIPWFFWQGVPVVIMDSTHLRNLIDSLPKLKKLQLVGIRLSRVVEVYVANNLGIEAPQDPISGELVQWFANGGGSVHMRPISITDQSGGNSDLFNFEFKIGEKKENGRGRMKT